jgi:uncharacterized protein YjbJ (UPF0337 family)
MLVAAWAAGCSLLQTPCDRVASSICGISGEEESCRFLKAAKSGNEALQQACTELEPAARSYAASPGSLVEKGRWLGARVALSAVGFVGEVTARKPADKLEAAGQRLEEAGSKVREGLEEAGEALKDAVRDAAR